MTKARRYTVGHGRNRASPRYSAGHTSAREASIHTHLNNAQGWYTHSSDAQRANCSSKTLRKAYAFRNMEIHYLYIIARISFIYNYLCFLLSVYTFIFQQKSHDPNSRAIDRDMLSTLLPWYEVLDLLARTTIVIPRYGRFLLASVSMC